MDRPVLTAANIGASCALFFFIGSFFATGVFNTAIDDAVSPSSPLRGKWAGAMGPFSLLSAPIMILSAVYLEKALVGNKSRRVKLLSGFSSLFFFSFALAAAGVRHANSALVTIGVILLGIPLGTFYFLCTELLGAWVPRRRGLAVGCGQASFGLGTIVFSTVFSVLVHQLGAATAIWCAGMLLGIPALLATMFLSWPKSSPIPGDVECRSNEIRMDSSMAGRKVELKALLRDPPFWQYLALVFCSQTGFAMVPFFFEMGDSYGGKPSTVVLFFQICNAIGTAARLGSGMLSDMLSSGSTSGARKLMIILLALQTMAFGALALTHESRFTVFAICSILLFVAFAGGACACAVLARDLYGTTNSGTVYAFGAGLAIGFGESIAAQVVTITLNNASIGMGAAKFSSAFWVLTACSLFGFGCAVGVRRSKLAFPRMACDVRYGNEHTVMYGSVR